MNVQWTSDFDHRRSPRRKQNQSQDGQILGIDKAIENKNSGIERTGRLLHFYRDLLKRSEGPYKGSNKVSIFTSQFY